MREAHHDLPQNLDDVHAMYPGVQTRPDTDAAADRILAGMDGLADVSTPEDMAMMRESLSLWFARSFDEEGNEVPHDGDEPA